MFRLVRKQFTSGRRRTVAAPCKNSASSVWERQALGAQNSWFLADSPEAQPGDAVRKRGCRHMIIGILMTATALASADDWRTGGD